MIRKCTLKYPYTYPMNLKLSILLSDQSTCIGRVPPMHKSEFRLELDRQHHLDKKSKWRQQVVCGMEGVGPNLIRVIFHLRIII